MDEFSEKCNSLVQTIIGICEGESKDVALVTVCVVFGSLVKALDQTRENAHNLLDSVLDDMEVR